MTIIYALKIGVLMYALWMSINTVDICNEYLRKVGRLPQLRSDFLTIVQSMWLIIVSLTAVIVLLGLF